jgi:hypothetical protein
MVVIMIKTSYDYVYEACNHVLINENTRQLIEEGKILESTSHDITCGIDEVELRCFSEENKKLS